MEMVIRNGVRTEELYLRFLHTPLAKASGISKTDLNKNLICGQDSNVNRNFIVSTLSIEIENSFTSAKDKEQAFKLLPTTSYLQNKWSFLGKNN